MFRAKFLARFMPAMPALLALWPAMVHAQIPIDYIYNTNPEYRFRCARWWNLQRGRTGRLSGRNTGVVPYHR